METIPPLAIYGLVFIDICGHLIAPLVGLKSLKRAIRSHGFNRWLYSYVAIYSGAALALLLTLEFNNVVAYICAQIAAWLTLPLWLCVCEIARKTRREGLRRPGTV